MTTCRFYTFASSGITKTFLANKKQLRVFRGNAYTKSTAVERFAIVMDFVRGELLPPGLTALVVGLMLCIHAFLRGLLEWLLAMIALIGP